MTLEERIAALEARVQALEPRPAGKIPADCPIAFLGRESWTWSERGTLLADERIAFAHGRGAAPQGRDQSWLHYEIRPGEFVVPVMRRPGLVVPPGLGFSLRDEVEAPGAVFGFEPGPIVGLDALIEIRRRVLARQRLAAGQV
jgi:hypothetical protein